MDWSLVSNDSIFSLRTLNVSLYREHGLIGLAGALKLDETHNELVNKITKTNSVISLPPDNESLDTEKSDYESDDNEDEEIIKVNNEEHEISDPKEIKLSYLSEPVNQITETNPVIYLPPVEESLDTGNSDIESEEDEEKEEIEYDGDDVKAINPDDSNGSINQITETNLVPPLLPVKELQDTDESDTESDDDEEEELEDDVKEIIADDSSICCRSDTSNNSISSFSFPILHNEDGSVKTPYLETSWNVFDKRLELSREETQTRPQPQFYFIPASHMLTHLPPQRNSSSNQASQTQSQKASRNRWFSCFYDSFQDD